MRIANWNVNSARTRVDRMVAFLARHDVDVLTVQETKCKDEQFPYQAFEECGYQVAHLGHNQWNGVALISRVGLTDVCEHFPHQPGFNKDPAQRQAREARALSALCQGVRVWSLYVPNGREIADPHYDYKLRWLYSLADYVTHSAEHKLVLSGDFNIAPEDKHVWDIEAFIDKTHITEPERQAFDNLIDAGLSLTSPTEGFSYWDYQAGRFQRNQGMLIDFQLARGVSATQAFIDVDERKGKGASDHAPVIVDYKDE
ncbi:exodeoxyribonuclease III [Corynebacterium sp. sy017]|uniref:exodeoxyribonuclease III n=1 Tax=unclassified Corynebacterium TaxID=2624378 RepID=UPI001184FEBC|nr:MULTISPECIES: exodeoxyribonuclease III [unclassified Corynebacterium]MBP3088447.1 exodeoxyribonuclease III [Corynebacterium sp. sy017]QDZ41882.1 exodeoxyribonuclease III [Corynebacterium sp. sy039]TSD91756.1 exodeoxyribonuclease III [Corynebacterium sp. SY003]